MKKRYFKGSLTIEAAGVMAVLLFGLGTVIMEAGRIHDEVTGAMVIHEAVEKSRHEKELDLKEAASFFQANRGARLRLRQGSRRELGKGNSGTAVSSGGIFTEDHIDRKAGG